MISPRERSALAARAQQLPALLRVGKAGPTPAIADQLARLLAVHELVKLRFVGFKEERESISASLATETGSELVRVIGNTAVFWKERPTGAGEEGP